DSRGELDVVLRHSSYVDADARLGLVDLLQLLGCFFLVHPSHHTRASRGDDSFGVMLFANLVALALERLDGGIPDRIDRSIESAPSGRRGQLCRERRRRRGQQERRKTIEGRPSKSTQARATKQD